MLPRPISQRSTVYIKQEAAKGGQMFSSHFVPEFAKDMHLRKKSHSVHQGVLLLFKKSHIQSIGECPSVSLSLPAVVPYTGVCLLESWAGVGSDSRFFISAAAAASARWRGFFLCCCALHLHLPPSRPQNRRSRSPRSLAAAAAAAIAFSPNPKKTFFFARDPFFSLPFLPPWSN